MKKLLLLVGLIFVLQSQTKLIAQDTTEVVTFNAILGGVFDLIIEDGEIQTAYFNTADDYDIGVSETQGVPGIDPGFTTIAMVSTGNWYLTISSSDFLPSGGGATGSIPINNLGVWCEATGAHQFGIEVTCAYADDPDNALGLTDSPITLIDLLTENSGVESDNLFILHWLMGTMQGTMNNTSMFLQLSAGIFSQGTYATNVILTLTEIP